MKYLLLLLLTFIHSVICKSCSYEESIKYKDSTNYDESIIYDCNETKSPKSEDNEVSYEFSYIIGFFIVLGVMALTMYIFIFAKQKSSNVIDDSSSNNNQNDLLPDPLPAYEAPPPTYEETLTEVVCVTTVSNN